jgi:uncharacterized protein YbaR (Trm112 family)
MIKKHFLEMLVCPVTKTSLHPAPPELIEKLNLAIAEGRIVDRTNKKVELPVEAGLLGEGDQIFYRIEDDIPVMLPEEAILLDQLS